MNLLSSGKCPLNRLVSIDLLRGLIMVIMALDHVRDFFFTHTIDPVNLQQTTPGLFFTRWITHFCAPTFLLLAGVGIALMQMRGKTGSALSRFLLTRGLWLIFLEWCVVRTLGWAWNFDFTYLPCWVIWTLGWSMIVLAGLVRLPVWVSLCFSMTLIAGHHLGDDVKGEQLGFLGVPWYFLHDSCEVVVHPQQGLVKRDQVNDNRGIILSAGYPLIPWIGVMALGFGLGQVYRWEANRRQRFLVLAGCCCLLGFILIRVINRYGETQPWAEQPTILFTVLSFLNCTKQPPSLCYLLMTLGPVLLFLAVFDRGAGRWAQPFITFGKVPLFFYLLHLPLIHGLCVLAAWWQLKEFPHWLFTNPPLGDMPDAFGFPLWFSYLVWIGVTLLLYPLCQWFAGVKARHKSPWLSYL